MGQVRVYRYVDAALIRAAAYPSGLVLPPPPDLSGDGDANAGRWRHWIEQVWAQEPVALAVEQASPVLADRISQLCAGLTGQPGQVRRIAVSLHRYLLRLRHRSTPFGLFAGIAPARIGPGLVVRWGEDHRLVARVDAVWLADVIARLEACPELLRRLPVMADSTCFVRDGRLVVPCQQPPLDSRSAPAEVSVRHTRAVQTVVAAAALPVAAGDLAAKLAASYPDTPPETIESFLAELVSRRVLLTSLRPPMTVTDTLGHVIGQLSAVDAGNIAAVAPAVRALHEIQATLARHTGATSATRRGLRASAAEAMTAQSSIAEQPLAGDLRLDCSLTLPSEVAREAEKAAGALARLTPFPSGSLAWQDYHTRFLERYGTGTLVPVVRLTDPDTGLGFPAAYRGSLAPRPAPALTARDERLLALAQRAACEGTREIVLTEALLSGLAPGPAGIPLPQIDLRFQLRAPTPGALERGDFTLAVTGLTPAAGATAGRFLDLLDTADRDRMTVAYTSLPTLDSDAIRAQVSSPPLHVRTENVSRAPALWPVISVAEHRSGPALPLEDLAVTADVTRLYLMSLATGRPVEPTVMNAVDLANFTHPLARLLCELPRARAAAFGPFTWGAASRLPFLPGVRYGRTVLAPPTWRIEGAELAGPEASFAQWTASLAAWRRRFRLPGTIDLGDDDRLLRLELDHNADAALLRAELHRSGHATLREAPGPTAYGWFDGRAHEITLALASARPPGPPRSGVRTRAVVVEHDHGHLPGASTCAYLKLYGHPDRVPEILTSHLSRLWDGWDSPPEWWFVRYRDPLDHLRLRFRLPHPEAFGQVCARVGAWAANLRRRGLLGQVQWDTYYPEAGRYGTGPTLTAAEAVFVADSAAAIAQLTLTASGAASPQAIIAASLVDLAASITGDTGSGMRWMIDHVTAGTAAHPARPVHQEATRLANPRDNFASLRDLPGSDRVTAAWATRREAVEHYRIRLAADGGEPEAVLPSLMHLHHLRAAGIDEAGEHACYRLSRSVALAWASRSAGAVS